MTRDHKAPTSEEINALIREVDRVCQEAEFVSRRMDVAMKRSAFWPDRRRPRHWDSPPTNDSDAGDGDIA